MASVELLGRSPDGGEHGVTLTRCVHLAPGRWLFEGEIAPGALPRTVELTVFPAPLAADVIGSNLALALEVEDSGPFSAAVETATLTDADLTGVDGGECGYQSTNSWLQVLLEATEALDYQAPGGTVQALGVGADLSDPGSLAAGLAALAWFGHELPFELLGLPEDLQNASLWLYRWLPYTEVDVTNRCRSFEYRIDEIVVRHERGCRTYPVDSEFQGWTLVIDGEQSAGHLPYMVRRIGDGWVTIDGDGRVEEMEGVASSLGPVRNLVVGDRPVLDHEALIRARLERDPDLGSVEPVFRVDTDPVIEVWAGQNPDPSDSCALGTIKLFELGEIDGVPAIVGGFGGGSWDECAYVSSSWGQGEGARFAVYVADPGWMIVSDDPDRWGAGGPDPRLWVVEDPEALNTIDPPYHFENQAGEATTCPPS